MIGSLGTAPSTRRPARPRRDRVAAGRARPDRVVERHRRVGRALPPRLGETAVWPPSARAARRRPGRFEATSSTHRICEPRKSCGGLGAAGLPATSDAGFPKSEIESELRCPRPVCFWLRSGRPVARPASWAMGSPNPVPPKRCSPFDCPKRDIALSSSAAFHADAVVADGKGGPSSDRPSPACRLRSGEPPPPGLVNLRAFWTRLLRIW